MRDDVVSTRGGGKGVPGCPPPIKGGVRGGCEPKVRRLLAVALASLAPTPGPSLEGRGEGEGSGFPKLILPLPGFAREDLGDATR